MANKKLFNYDVDIKNKRLIYPCNNNSKVLFKTDEKEFFIYSLYTNSKLENPKLYEISEEVFNKIKSNNLGVIDISFKSKNEILAVINFSEIKAMTDNETIEESLIRLSN